MKTDEPLPDTSAFVHDTVLAIRMLDAARHDLPMEPYAPRGILVSAIEALNTSLRLYLTNYRYGRRERAA